MGLFKNLVMFDQHVLRDGFNSIVPDLATKWSWDSSNRASLSAARGG